MKKSVVAIILLSACLCGCGGETVDTRSLTAEDIISSETVLTEHTMRDYAFSYPSNLETKETDTAYYIYYDSSKDHPAVLSLVCQDMDDAIIDKVYTDDFVQSYLKPFYSNFKDFWCGEVEVRTINNCICIHIPYTGTKSGFDLFGNVDIFYESGNDYIFTASEAQVKGNANYSSDFKKIIDSIYYIGEKNE